jgi:hypothetical protein
MIREKKPRFGCIAALYIAAAPIYICRFLFTALRLFRLRRASARGYLACPHCGVQNALDVLATCPKCHTTEYGNRLRCTGCGIRATAFPCEECGVTIRLL